MVSWCVSVLPVLATSFVRGMSNADECGKARIPRRRHRHRHPREEPRRHVRHARIPEVSLVASSTTRRHSRDDPREYFGEDVGVGVVECDTYTDTDTFADILARIIARMSACH